ncbi:MAG TPA: helicase, partial [Candidatus Accumulibacter sp.]|nr:helicase [Accumulibacter sp.]
MHKGQQMIDLTAEQNEVVNGIMAWIKDDKKPIAILRGSAGTGKTTLLKAVVEKLSESKKTYSLLAPTGRAARILGKKTGKQSKTIHSEIYELGDIKANDDSDAIQGELDSP